MPEGIVKFLDFTNDVVEAYQPLRNGNRGAQADLAISGQPFLVLYQSPVELIITTCSHALLQHNSSCSYHDI